MSVAAAHTLTVPEIRTELENLGERLNGLRAAERTDETRAEMRQVVDEIGYVDHLYKVAQRSAEIDAMEAGFQLPSGGPRGATMRTDQPDLRTVGARFTDTDEYRAWAQGSGSGTFEMEVRALVDSTGGIDYGSDAADGPGLLRPIGTPVMPPQTMVRTRLFLRDALTVVSTTLANVPYVKELNAEANAGQASGSSASGAQFVNEGQQKPEVKIDFEPDDAPIRKVAAWIPMTTEILQDAPTLRGYIDSRLRYMVDVAEERALLNGNGTAPNIRGIRQTNGVQSQSSSGAGETFITIGNALSKLEVVDGEPTFVAMNPADYWSAVTSRHANQFDGPASGGAPFNAPPAQMWGVGVIRTNAMEAKKALVGCRLGAVVLDREQTVIRVGDQHLDYFTTNRVAVLAEKRVGLAVHRPDWFVEATLS
jgi:HK97 family phage major capsid protein